MPSKKEIRLPTLARAMARSKNRLAPKPTEPVVPAPEVTVPTPEEPRFFGRDFARLIQTYRKMGTLREQNVKRAGLTKGMRIMSHVYPDAKSPSIADIELVILDAYRGKLAEVFLQHRLAFLLDGVASTSEAIRVLQQFSRNQIHPGTEIDYFTFISASLFDQMDQELQQEFLSLPVEEAMVNARFSHFFLPSLCQNIVWRGLGLADWIKFLERMKAITPEKAAAWRDYHIPGSQTTNGPAGFVDTNQMQTLLNMGDEADERMYRLCVLGDLDAFSEAKTPKAVNLLPAGRQA